MFENVFGHSAKVTVLVPFEPKIIFSPMVRVAVVLDHDLREGDTLIWIPATLPGISWRRSWHGTIPTQFEALFPPRA